MFPIPSSPIPPQPSNFPWVDSALSAVKNINHDDKANLVSVTVLTTSFYISNMIMQRCMGLAKLHAGHHGFITSTLGCVLTASSLLVAQEAEKYARKKSYEMVFPPRRESIWGLRSPSQFSTERYNVKNSTRQLLVGLGVFALLERGFFRTALPSSVIAPGVFANALTMTRRSVIATSAIATDSQRQKIQILGKRFGCHQCGSRQFFSRRGFIADHMPPTKLALEMSQSWWRKLFKITVKQRLWAQCQKCFQLQGSAVRTWTHQVVFHNSLKLHHLSPAIAFFLVQQPDIVRYVDFCVDPLVDVVENVKKSDIWKTVSGIF